MEINPGGQSRKVNHLQQNAILARHRSRILALHHCQLLTQSEILRSDFSDIPWRKKQTQQRKQKCDHGDKSGRPITESQPSSAKCDFGKAQVADIGASSLPTADAE